MPSSEALTTAELARLAGVSVAAVKKRADVRQFILPDRARTGGKPGLLYSPEALRLWRRDLELPTESARKLRADCGRRRKVDELTWRRIVDRVRGLYLANAQKNLLLACEEAARQLGEEGLEVTINVYKTLKRKAYDHSGLHISPFYREGWEALHEDKWRKKDAALGGPHVNYDVCALFESLNWAGAGFGAGRIWSLDGRKSDAWARKGNDGIAPYAIYINDALTGYPLWIEPVERETKKGVIAALLKCMSYWRRVPDLGIVLDGGLSNTAKDTVGILSTMIDPIAWDYAAKYPEVYGRGGSPVIMNRPHIPTSIFKAALERSFKQRKDEYDATRHARTYQGGNRSEAVQLTVAAIPVITATTSTLPEYFRDYLEWTYSGYIDRARPTKFPALVERGISPSIRAAFDYYGGYSAPEQLPDVDRMAVLLYWASDDKSIVRAERGFAETRTGGRIVQWACSELDHRYIGQRVAVVPIPGDDMHAAVLLANDPTKPRVIGLAINTVANSVAALRYVRPIVNETRALINQSMRDARSAYETAEYRNTPRQAEIPSAPALEAWLDDAKSLPPATTPEPVIGEISSDTADLLRDIEDLLS